MQIVDTTVKKIQPAPFRASISIPLLFMHSIYTFSNYLFLPKPYPIMRCKPTRGCTIVLPIVLC